MSSLSHWLRGGIYGARPTLQAFSLVGPLSRPLSTRSALSSSPCKHLPFSIRSFSNNTHKSQADGTQQDSQANPHEPEPDEPSQESSRGQQEAEYDEHELPYDMKPTPWYLWKSFKFLYFGLSVGGIVYALSHPRVHQSFHEYYLLRPLLKQGVADSFNEDWLSLGGLAGQAGMNSPIFRQRLCELDVQTRLIQGLLDPNLSAEQRLQLVTIYAALLSLDAMPGEKGKPSEHRVLARLSIQPNLVYALCANLNHMGSVHFDENTTSAQIIQFNEVASGTWLCLKYLFSGGDQFPLPRWDFMQSPGLSYLLGWYAYCSQVQFFGPITSQIAETLQTLMPFLNKHYDHLVQPLVKDKKLADLLFNASANLGFMASENNMKESAVEALEMATRLQPTNGLIKAQLAKEYQDLGQADEALKAAEKSLQLEPHSLVSQYRYYDILKQQQELDEETKQQLVNSLEQSMNPVSYQLQHARMNPNKEQLEQIEQTPEFLLLESAYMLVVKTYEELKKPAEAMRTAMEWAKTFPLSAATHFHAGRLAIKTQDFPLAQQQLELAHRLDREKPEILYQLALVKYKQGQNEQAEKYVDRVKTALRAGAPNLNTEKLCMSMPNLHYLQAKLYEAKGDHAQAAEEIEKVLSLRPNHLAAHLLYADLLKQMKVEEQKYFTHLSQALQAIHAQVSTQQVPKTQFLRTHPKSAALVQEIGRIRSNAMQAGSSSALAHLDSVYQQFNLAK